MPRARTALTIAGSDSGGGAGIQADLRVFVRLGVFGTTAITAVTAQNTLGIQRWMSIGAALVRAQIDAVATDLRPDAVKSGMLANADIVRAVASALRKHGLRRYVLDPVILASSGTPLLDRAGVRALRRELIPLATIVTPNLAEAAALTGERVAADPVTNIDATVERRRPCGAPPSCSSIVMARRPRWSPAVISRAPRRSMSYTTARSPPGSSAIAAS